MGKKTRDWCVQLTNTALEVFLGESVERKGVFLAFLSAGALSAQREGTEPLQPGCTGQGRWEMSWKGQSREFVGQIGQNWSRERYNLGSRSWRKLSNEAFFSERQGCEWYCKICFHGFEEYVWENLCWRETEMWSRFFLRSCKYLVFLSEFLICFKKNKKVFWEFFFPLINSLKTVGWLKKKCCLCRIKGEDWSFKLVSCEYICSNVPGRFYTQCKLPQLPLLAQGKASSNSVFPQCSAIPSWWSVPAWSCKSFMSKVVPCVCTPGS